VIVVWGGLVWVGDLFIVGLVFLQLFRFWGFFGVGSGYRFGVISKENICLWQGLSPISWAAQEVITSRSHWL